MPDNTNKPLLALSLVVLTILCVVAWGVMIGKL